MGLFAFLVIDMMLRDQVILAEAGYLLLKPAIMVVAGLAAIDAFWILSPGWKTNVNPISVLTISLAYAAIMYFMMLYVGLSTVPKIMTRIASEEAVLEATVIEVKQRQSRRDLHLHLLGRAKQYRFEIEGQPELVPYVSDSGLGYKVYPVIVGLEPIYFVGKENWFGFHVERATRERPPELLDG